MHCLTRPALHDVTQRQTLSEDADKIVEQQLKTLGALDVVNLRRDLFKRPQWTTFPTHSISQSTKPPTPRSLVGFGRRLTALSAQKAYIMSCEK